MADASSPKPIRRPAAKKPAQGHVGHISNIDPRIGKPTPAGMTPEIAREIGKL